MENTLPIVIADAPDALSVLCGVNLLERSLRILQRLGFARVVVFSSTPEIVGAYLVKPSWARKKLPIQLVSTATRPLSVQLALEQTADRFLIVPANVYCDPRLLAALCARSSPAALADSNPPEFAKNLIRNPCGPALITRDFLSALSPAASLLNELTAKIDPARMQWVDAAEEDDYIVSMRRHVRPLCFRATQEQDRRIAERIILDSAQKGTLDLPAYIHGPVETLLISILCKTPITPNQITIIGIIIGCTATVAFVTGRVGLGIVAALIFGVVDGLDGKQARVKIETTTRGKWEHHFDYLIENSWWLTIAFYLWRSGRLPEAFYLFALLVGSHLLDEFAKRRARIATGRLLDDLAPFDRVFRLIAARRNIYVWILAFGFLSNAFPQSYAIICGWAAVSAAVHLLRAGWICNTRRGRVVDPRA